ncbi:MAG: hypothetical protein F7C33_04240 [Desulfurococcales archaeon]|nr:hypothetical protein [Desulfurococcales archaeon]
MKGVARAVRVGRKSSSSSVRGERVESIVERGEIRVEVEYLYIQGGKPVD